MTKTWKDLMVKWHPTGSNYICNPPVENTDIDVVCLLDTVNHYPNELEFIGWTVDAEHYLDQGTTDFWSFRNGSTNLIVTERVYFYDKFVEATEKAKELNLRNKQERVDFFQKVLYG